MLRPNSSGKFLTIKTNKPIDYQKILAAPWAPPPNNSTYIMYTLFDTKFEMLN